MAKNSHYDAHDSSKKELSIKEASNNTTNTKIKRRRKRKNYHHHLLFFQSSVGEQFLIGFVFFTGLVVLFNIYHILFSVHHDDELSLRNLNHQQQQQQHHPYFKHNVYLPQSTLQKSNPSIIKDDDINEVLTSESPSKTLSDEDDDEREDTQQENEQEDEIREDKILDDSISGDIEPDGIIANDADEGGMKEERKNRDNKNKSDDKDKDSNDDDDKIDEHLLRILRHVGINEISDLIDDDDKKKLPSWKEVIEQVGNNGPVILGLDRCHEYNTKIVPPSQFNERHLGVAGPFSSGTHYFYDILSKNCKFTNPDIENHPKTKYRNDAILWQVPWGKHQSPNFRTKHSVHIKDEIDKEKEQKKKNKRKNNSDTTNTNIDRMEKILEKAHESSLPPSLYEYNTKVLPIVTVRNPFTWMQSMCKTRYAAHWYHIVPYHCPNFIPNQVEWDWYNKTKDEITKFYNNDKAKVWKVDNVMNKANYTLDKSVVPLYVKYHSENSTHDSLVQVYITIVQVQNTYKHLSVPVLSNCFSTTLYSMHQCTHFFIVIPSLLYLVRRHMWKDWYQDYYDATYPRLMIRLEDLVFYPHETIKQVCECVDGGIYVGDENLILSLESAIQGSGKGVDNIHGHDRTGLLGAMSKHISGDRTEGMTHDDYKFATNVLQQSDVMKYFQYKFPSSPPFAEN